MSINRFAWLAVALWSGAVVAIGAADAFIRPEGSLPLPVAIGATLPIAVFLAAYRLSQAFRGLVLSADLRFLAGMQAWRMGGFLFVVLYANDLLPGLFALPAGLGDMAVGLAAPWMIVKVSTDRKFAASRGFVLWNLLGILDLAVALSMGVLGSGVIAGLVPVTTAPMAALPLVLIPAFFVPLFVIFHLAALFQARRIATRGDARFGDIAAVPA